MSTSTMRSDAKPIQALAGRFMLTLTLAMWIGASVLVLSVEIVANLAPWDPVVVRRLAASNVAVGAVAAVFAGLQAGLARRA